MLEMATVGYFVCLVDGFDGSPSLGFTETTDADVYIYQSPVPTIYYRNKIHVSIIVHNRVINSGFFR